MKLLSDHPRRMTVPRIAPPFLLAVAVVVIAASAPKAAAQPRLRFVRTVDSTTFGSPDPAGAAYVADWGRFVVSDSEAEELPFRLAHNLFQVDDQGRLIRTDSTLAYSKEPTGIAVG